MSDTWPDTSKQSVSGVFTFPFLVTDPRGTDLAHDDMKIRILLQIHNV